MYIHEVLNKRAFISFIIAYRFFYVGLTCICVPTHSLQDEDEAALIAKLFSSQLSTEKKVKEHFLPTMKTIATCQLEHFRDVAIYMLVMLLHKMSKKGLSLATKTLPRKVNTVQY